MSQSPLPLELYDNIVKFADYQTLRELAKTSLGLKTAVQRRLKREAKVAREALGDRLIEDLTDQELMERLYHLNNYKNPSTDGIIIEGTWRGGDWRIQPIGTWRNWQKNHGVLFNTIEVRVPYDVSNYIEKWDIKSGILHRLDGPAITEWKDGAIVNEQWYIKGKRQHQPSSQPSSQPQRTRKNPKEKHTPKRGPKLKLKLKLKFKPNDP